MHNSSVLLLPLTLMLWTACGGGKTDNGEPAAEPQHLNEVLVEIEAEVLASMDPTTSPCDDFYQYACGGWLESNELPADKAAFYRSFNTIRDRNESIIHDMLETWAATPPEDAGQAQLGGFYQSCMDIDAIDAAGMAPIQSDLDRIDALSSKKDLADEVGRIHMTGLDVLFGIWVDADAKNPEMNILHVSQGGTGLPDREYYLSDDEKKVSQRVAYEALVAQMLTLAGASEADGVSQAAKIMAFETAMAEVSWPLTDVYDSVKTYNKLDREGLQALTPRFPWTSFLSHLSEDELTQINVSTPSYFEALGGLLDDTDLDTLKLYLRWSVLRNSARDLSSDVSNAHFAFYGTVMTGQKEDTDRWKRCVAKTEEGLGDLLGEAYVNVAFAGDSKAEALEMLSGIETAFVGALPGLGWMDDTTRARAEEKAHAVRNKIGYPDKWKDYSSLEFGDVWFENRTIAQEFGIAFHLGRTEKPVDKGEWYMSASMVNAYYNPTGNEIVFPAGILQPPFYSSDFPKAMNFGGIGMVMGHELTHGFDDEGRRFSAEGQLTDWWEPEVVERFEKVTACVVEQYAGFEIEDGVAVNGELTLGENIADLGGIKETHTAYLNWVQKHGPEDGLAGLSPEQLLFVSFAQSWCAELSPDMARMRVQMDPHSPAKFRVNGPLSNLPAFGDAFQCEEGSKMRPADICGVW
ncbi:MAG: M13 family peptidase [Rhodobacterales bacterium]|nr:M13 family peptidase [Rhodobacterales bacterium]